MALTRILNNQVTDSSAGNTYLGINAGTKIQDYSITSGKIANNLTYASNLTVQGNLDVQGTTTTIDTYNVVIEDPLIVLAKDQTGSPTLDIGYIGERGTSNNIAFAWIESSDEFATVFTDTLVSNTTVNVLSYANFHTFDANVTGNLTVIGTTNISNVSIGNISVTGAITATGNITGGNLNSNAGITGTTVTTTGTGTFGNVSTAGTINATGNITGGNINSNADISGTTVTATGTATVGNVSTAGTVTATGNVSGGNIVSNAAITGTTLTTTGNIDGANVNASANVTGTGAVFSGNVTADTFIGNISGNIDAGGANTQVQFNDDDLLAGSSNFTFDKATNLMTVGNISTGGTVNATGNVSGGNIVSNAAITGTTITTTGTGTFGNVSTAGTVDATGNITGGNLNSNSTITGTTITTTGTGTFGNVSTAGTVNATGNVSGGNIVSNAAITGTTITTTGTGTFGNVSTAGTINATGNITGGNINSNAAITGTTLTTSGNASVGNLSTAGEVTATGNVTAAIVRTGTVTTTSGDLILNSASGVLQWDGSGNIVMNSQWINGLSDPVQSFDAATKQYVDDAVSSGIHIHTPVDVETAAALTTVTYANGGNTFTVTDTLAGNTVVFSTAANLQVNDQLWFTNSFNGIVGNLSYFVVSTPNTSAAVLSTVYNGVPVSNITTGGSLTQPVRVNSGIGATLTATANGAIVVDGVTLSAGNRVMVNDQLNQIENGVYVVTDAGNVTAPYILTRSSDTNIYEPDTSTGLDQGSYFYVEYGDTGAGSSYVKTAPSGPFIFGVGNIEFTLFSASQVYSANTSAGLSLTGTVFAAKVDNNTTAFDGGGNIIVKAGANLVTPNIGAATGTSLALTGNISAGNASISGLINATGNITGGNINSNAGISGTTLTTTGTATVGNLSTAGTVNATGNITGGNLNSNAGITGTTLTVTTVNTSDISATGAINATGNITGGNLNSNNTITSTTLTTTGTATVGNLSTAGTINATGNITGGNINSNAAITGTTLTTTGTATVGNLSTAGTVNATGNITGGNINSNAAITSVTITATGNIDGGNVNATGNVTGTGAVFTGNVTAANFIGNISGNIDAGGSNTQVQFNDDDVLNGSSGFTFDKATNVMTAGNISTGGTVNATGNITGGNINSNATITGTTLTTTGTATVGNLSTAGAVNATGNITGGNLNSNGALTVTTTGTLGNLEVSGTGNIAGKVIIGDPLLNSANTANATLALGSTTSMLMPVGNIVQRPSTAVIGMLRFTTTGDGLEVYTSTGWEAVGAPSFTVITADSFTGNGVANTFTLSEDSTTAGTIVSINGIVQIPTTAYAVSGNVLTFTESPAVSDVIDARILTTTTTVTNITNISGNAVVEVLDTADTVQITGNLLPSANVTYDLGSNTMRWNDAYFNGTSITLGNVIIKNNTGNTIGFFGPDGTTPATIDSTNIDTTRIANGLSSVSVNQANANVHFVVNNNPIIKVTGAGIVNDMGNGVGNIGNSTGYFNTIFAKATSAQYADLAEMYVADQMIDPGTVVCFGGNHEVTICDTDGCSRVAGVVSTNPSYIMNAGLAGDHVVAVALTGRVPTRVTGQVRKGDMMVATADGRARSETAPAVGQVIGKALADFDGADGVIEVVVGRL